MTILRHSFLPRILLQLTILSSSTGFYEMFSFSERNTFVVIFLLSCWKSWLQYNEKDTYVVVLVVSCWKTWLHYNDPVQMLIEHSWKVRNTFPHTLWFLWKKLGTFLCKQLHIPIRSPKYNSAESNLMLKHIWHILCLS